VFKKSFEQSSDLSWDCLKKTVSLVLFERMPGAYLSGCSTQGNAPCLTNKHHTRLLMPAESKHSSLMGPFEKAGEKRFCLLRPSVVFSKKKFCAKF
jgi:hypothetical protein